MTVVRYRRSFLLLLIFSASLLAHGQQMQFQIDPAQSKVDFVLGDILHTVRGTFDLKPTTIYFDPQSGAASGAFVVDATSGNSGSKGRDKKMHKEVLESAKFPEIRFTVQRFKGTLPVNGTAQVEMTGIMNLHGGEHVVTVAAPVQVANGRASADVHFVVPYVQWGLKNPSTFVLRVNDRVDIVVRATGLVTTVASARTGQH
ncbi:MAG: YceI family protein [Acidobacteriaceae bacterium]|nr:YceI family protein [Acidobacteriaceae bacterium]